MVWFEMSRRQQISDDLQRIQAVQPDGLLAAMEILRAVSQMDAALVGFQISGDVADREAFNGLARQVARWLTDGQQKGTRESDRRQMFELETAANRYFQEAAALTERELRTLRRDSLLEAKARIAELSQPLRELAERLVDSRRALAAADAKEVQTALESLRSASAEVRAAVIGLLLITTLLVVFIVVGPGRQRLAPCESSGERQERLASLGVLAAGVAHEIRNPLTAIKFRLFSLRKSLPAEFAGNDDVAVIDHEIHRLEALVKDVLQFARPSPPQLADLLADQLIRSVMELLGNELGRRGVRLELGASEPIAFRGDLRQLQQVLINLVQNAADAIGSDGQVTLSVRQGAAVLRGRSSPVLIIEVADTGPGIPLEVESRLFEPFFSTKQGGTGLGLAIAARIVEKHGGQVQYSTRLNRGTTFSVVLPRGSKDESNSVAD